jgi:DNA-binding CsgD family transcriptional regulator
MNACALLSTPEHRPFFDGLSDPIGLLGRGLMLHDLNDAAARLLGGTREERVGTSGLLYAPGDFAKRFNEILDRVIQSEENACFSTFYDGVFHHMHMLSVTPCDALGDCDENLALVWFRPCSVACEGCGTMLELPEVSFRAPFLGPLAALTPREMAVLRLVGLGFSSKEMGTLLHRSPRTIESNIISIGRKLGLTTRVQQARAALRYGLAGVAEEPDAAPLLDETFFAERFRPSS